MVRGIVPADEARVSILGERMVEGGLETLEPRSYNIVLGRELALWLGVRMGDSVVVTTDFQATPMGAVPQLKRFTVSGIFEAGYQEADRGLAVVHIEDLQRLLRMGDTVTGVRLQMHDMDQAFAVARELALALDGPYVVSDWTMENAHLFRALKLEKTMIAILLSLIIAMGAFNLVSSQVMLVTDKQADIAILRTLGLSPGGVMKVFMVQGSLIGVIGTVLGVVTGLVLCLGLLWFGVRLDPDVYYVDRLPINVDPLDYMVVAACSLCITIAATIYPAVAASRLRPVEGIRYE